MKKQYKTFLKEARRNPDKNPKVSIIDIIENHYHIANKMSSLGIKNSFVSFTDVPKLGIRPIASHTGPLGVYAYPSKFVLKTDEIPYAGDRKYINIFELKSDSGVINLSKVKSSEYKKYLEKIEKMYSSKMKDDTVYQEIKRYSSNVLDDFEKYMLYFKSNPGFNLWSLIENYIEKTHFSLYDNDKAGAIWNKTLRNLGIHAAYDDGNHIIHSNEPTQLAVFDVRLITKVQRYDNK
jgi:hypothetical protein